MPAPYPTLPEIDDQLGALGDLQTYGTSVEGRPLLAVHVPCPGAERTVVVTAGIHGIEHVGVAVALEVLRRGPLDGANLLVCPVLNPDGYAHTVATEGREAVSALRKNARGVDLNRNFPLPYGATPSWIPTAGSLDPQSPTYRGQSPLSEPETHALAELLEQVRPWASANLHSFMGTLIAARVWHGSDWRAYTELCRAFRAGQGTGLGYPRLGTPIGDVFTGELEDWQHHVLRCWGVCVEAFSVAESLRQHVRAPTPFWRFNPREPEPVVQRDASGVRALLAHALTLPRPPERSEATRVRTAW
ncbi:MAG: DUF2817 domain-containing protein [Myxococcales bacterium]|nr:DUF2817 domain-containing protein [Myxococcales bacterium]